MHHGKAWAGRHQSDIDKEQRFLDDTKREFLAQYGWQAYHERTRAIARLPQITRPNGVVLYGLVCTADYGCGPHRWNVPESILWNLINLQHFRCPRHRW